MLLLPGTEVLVNRLYLITLCSREQRTVVVFTGRTVPRAVVAMQGC